MHPLLKCFSYSLATDGALLESELSVNRAWVKMLGRIKLLTGREVSALLKGLGALSREFSGKAVCEYLKDYEDVHTLIQSKLEDRIGKAAKKLHTGRSRNDLVVTSMRLYIKEKIKSINGRLAGLERALISLSEKAGGAVIAGMTHLRKAQPVLMAHHLLAYVEMLEEDRARLGDVLKRVDVLPLGSAALAGSSLPLDQSFLARELGFSKIVSNSLAGVSDRAFLTELLSVLAILWMHLSRLSEDFILWNSENFGYIELDDAFATGSSLMPQKKNPDVFELIRGRSGVVFGQLQALLTVQKGLPLAYNRDLQEDKPGAFDAVRKTEAALELLALTLGSTAFNFQRMKSSVDDDALFATDVLEYLVRKKVPFTEAHETVGKAVRYAQETGKRMSDFAIQEWKRFSKAFGQDVRQLFRAEVSVNAKKTIGSTNPSQVKKQIQRWKKILK